MTNTPHPTGNPASLSDVDSRSSLSQELASLRQQLEEKDSEIARWKHAYETTTHDDCICDVNSQHRIQRGCIVHDPLAEPTELPL